MAGPERAAALSASGLVIDAGMNHCRIQRRDAAGHIVSDRLLASNGELAASLAALRGAAGAAAAAGLPVAIGGRLAAWVRETLGCGQVVLPAAALWLAARHRLRAEGAHDLGAIELSASGYLVLGIDAAGALRDDLLLPNPRCGAGSGANLDRILQKLAIAREQVDALLAAYLGEAGAELRHAVPVRADRCGVFSTSATISDKNQGIPIAAALATTLKSEVLKACRKLPPGFSSALLCGRLFRWRYARDCAEDELRSRGVARVHFDPEGDGTLDALWSIACAGRAPERFAAIPATPLPPLPGFAALAARMDGHACLRLADAPSLPPAALAGRTLDIGLDVGSTMAKIVLADAGTGEALHFASHSNAGDTIETLQALFASLAAAGLAAPAVRGIGITGSARYQMREALAHVYPDLAERLLVLVENYAHARGSLALARRRATELAEQGVPVNAEFCILVDVGGEDTKISTLDLKAGELYGNAMNLKCSAGTGSLMDSLAAFFAITDIGAACREAQDAPRAHAIDATCAVLLMENARRLQVRGVPRAEILASALWAIAENMAQGLWPQIDLPRDAVVLLHGQTMRSDPLPLATLHRLAAYLGAPVYGLLPPQPGHRACLGLIDALAGQPPAAALTLPLADFVGARFAKRLIECRGAACDDPAARCQRAHLSCRIDGGKPVSFTLGGCSAINELLARTHEGGPAPAVPDTYKALWDHVDARLPRCEGENRLVIPRSFAVSEWAFLLAQLLAGLGLPVHVDNVRAEDLVAAQPLLAVDTCAPHLGAIGQYRRLAGAPHGLILAPQIEALPTEGRSRGLACTLNQGGIAVAAGLARQAHPEARFHLFHLDLGRLDGETLLAQLAPRLQAVFAHYGITPGEERLRSAIAGAIAAHRRLREEVAELAGRFAAEALAAGRRVALVVGREYVLNPGIYDSHIRRLLRDQQLVVIPSWALDLELDPDYAHLYWRNAHFIVSLLAAVAQRSLHRRLRHPGLRAAFARIEAAAALLPAIQVSTFACGPDSIIRPLVAEIMRERPFLLIQSDAVLKELAHLENRVNTHMKQLAAGLGKPPNAGGQPFSVRTLDELDLREAIDPATDAIYFPTLGDNRSLTAVLRSAGFTCIDNYDDETFDLAAIVSRGRRSTGEAVCTPLAAVYGDLERAIADFARRRAAGDPLVAGKQRLLFFEVKGNGPCRQGLYSNVHQLLFQRDAGAGRPSCSALPGGGVLRMLAGRESESFNIGLPEWTLVAAHQGVILQGVLHALLFAAAAGCADARDYERLLAEHRALKDTLYRLIEIHGAPGPAERAALRAANRLGAPGALLKFALYSRRSRPYLAPLRSFARRWLKPAAGGERLQILISGEIYMRVAQAEAIHRALVELLGCSRFELACSPAWAYLEYILDESSELARDRIERGNGDAAADRRCIRDNEFLRLLLRRGLAAPLYAAAGLRLPPSSKVLLAAAREAIPTLRPLGELLTYAGETISELQGGVDLVLNVAPTGCMVSSMGEALGPRLLELAGRGRIQHLFSADGSVDSERLAIALLKALGPEAFCRATG